MSLRVVVETHADAAVLAAWAASPSGPIVRHWLRLLADVDRRAKLKLSNDLVHVRTGNLRSSQQTPFLTIAGGRIVGVAQNTASYARAVHDGTRPHDIRPVKGRLLTGWTFNGAAVFTPLVHHPGTKARPWLREALTETMQLNA